MDKTKYLIIGNGIAGLSATKEIKKNDPQGSITMVSNEEFLTYYRLKLTKSLSKNVDAKELIINDQLWYDENNINVILSKIVEKIDIENKLVVLDNSKEIHYENLLIATGARPFVPPIHGKFKEGVFALRTIKDLLYIKEYLKDKKRVTIIGGGLLGLEAAWALKELGMIVSIIEFAPYLLPRQLDKELGDKLMKKLEQMGMRVYLASTAEEILGESKATGILINSGEIVKSDAILVSSGIRPNLNLVRDTAIDFDKGIKVDSNLKTNIDNVYAAGDVVEYDNMVIGLWTTSNEQGKIAGKNMTGGHDEYTHPKLFTSLTMGDINIFSVGNILDYDEVYEYIEEGKDIHHKLYTKEGKVTGAILFGDIKQQNNLRNAVFSQINVADYLENGISFKKIN